MKKKLIIALLCLTPLTFLACVEKKVENSHGTLDSISKHENDKVNIKPKKLSKIKLISFYQDAGLIESPYKNRNSDGDDILEFNGMETVNRLDSKRAAIFIDINSDEVTKTFVNVDITKHTEKEFKDLVSGLLGYATPNVESEDWLDYIIATAKSSPNVYFNWNVDGRVVQLSYYTNEYGSSFLVSIVDSKYSLRLNRDGNIVNLNEKGIMEQ